MQLRQSMRRAAKMRLALAGASGSGKTYSSLLIAYGMTGDWSKIAVIDSENGSVAQLNRVLDYGSSDYKFESCRSH